MADNSGWNAVAQAVGPALGAALGASAKIHDTKKRGEAVVANIESEGKTLEYKTNIRVQQLEDLTRAAADKMTANGLEALKAEARLKAASAETGSTAKNEVVDTAEVNRLHQDAVILRTFDVQKHSTKQQMLSDRLSFLNSSRSHVQSMQSGFGAGMSTFNASLTGFQSGLGYLNTTQQEGFWGTNTTGTTGTGVGTP